MTDTFKIIQTAPEFSYSSTGSYAFDSFKNSFKFTSKKPLTRSTVTTWNSNLNIVPIPTILRYTGDLGSSFQWSNVTWTLDSTLPDDSWSANAVNLTVNVPNPSTLISVAIGTLVMSIGYRAFYNCTNLTSITITIPNSVTSIGESAFHGCSNLASITIPNTVTSIGNYAFCGCYDLTSITIPNSVTSIGEFAFYNCTYLTSIIFQIPIPNLVMSIGGGAFLGCTNLTSITIPESVTSIGGTVFSLCDNLTSITIPKSVLNIDSEAFYRSGLTTVYISNPNNLNITSSSVGEFYGKMGVTITLLPHT